MRTGTITSDIDLTVVLTAHDETLVCGPTVTSAECAIATAQAAGISVEAIVALDRPTEQTRAWFEHATPAGWTRMPFGEGDLGRVRNAVLPRCRGRFVAFLDADDLFSENWLREGVLRLRAAEQEGRRAIVHPELNWLFDGAHSVFLKPDQDEALFSPWHFYFMNYYDSLCMAPREAYLEHPYVYRDIPGGLSFQDWQFSIETMAAGWTHVAARDTLIFKRRRDESLVSQSRNRRSLVRQLDAMAVDRVSDLGKPVLAEPGSKPVGVQRFNAEDRVATESKPGLMQRLGAAIRGRDPATPAPDLRHYGPVFADRVARARARRGHVTNRAAYNAIEPAFDHAYYLARYPDILAQEDVDPVAHYLRAGADEGRDPTPWFSTRTYLLHHPNLVETGQNPFHHYLTEKSKKPWTAAPFRDFEAMAGIVGMTPQDAFTTWKRRYEDVRARLETGTLGSQVALAEEIEPLVGLGWTAALQVKIPPFHSDEPVRRTTAIYRLAQSAGLKRARFVICVNRARFGAAPRIEGHLARSLAALHGPEQVLVVTTDKPGPMPPGKLPDGVRHVDFAELVPGLRGDPRQRVLAEFLRALHPHAVFNVNSRLMWDMMTPYGTAVAATSRLYACLMCNERGPTGHWTGYAMRRVYRHFDQLTGLLTDSHALRDEIIDRHRLPPDWAARVRVLPNPVDASIPVAPRPSTQPGRRPQIFWAGRMDAQKRVDLVFAIAAAMPQADFRLWGEPVMGAPPLPDPPGNVTLEGAYDAFGDLPLGEADLWLYTAAWDGVPVMLLEVAMTGIPVVGSDVGGTSEVLRDGLPPQAAIEDWTGAIRAVLDAPDAARADALTLRETLVASRTAQAHREILAALPGVGQTAAP